MRDVILRQLSEVTPEEQAILDEMLFRIESALGSRKKKYLLMNLPQA